MEPKKELFDHLKVRKTDSPGPAYFESLADQVIASQKKETKVIPLYKKPLFWITSAAASIIVVLILNMNNQSSESNNVFLALNDIAVEDIKSYISDNLDDFDTDLITEFIDESEIVDEPLLPSEEIEEHKIRVNDVQELEDINEDDILKYLNDQEIDIYEFDEESFI